MNVAVQVLKVHSCHTHAGHTCRSCYLTSRQTHVEVWDKQRSVVSCFRGVGEWKRMRIPTLSVIALHTEMGLTLMCYLSTAKARAGFPDRYISPSPGALWRSVFGKALITVQHGLQEHASHCVM